MKEADFGKQFRHWIKANPAFSGVYELKQTSTALPFTAVKDEQINFLLACKGKSGVLVRMTGVEGLPDYGYFRNAAAWIVIKYPRSFQVIDVETFLKEKKQSKRKSLTAARAQELSTWSVSRTLTSNVR